MKNVCNSTKIEFFNEYFGIKSLFHYNQNFKQRILTFLGNDKIIALFKVIFGSLLLFLPSMNLIISFYFDKSTYYNRLFSFENSSYLMMIISVLNAFVSIRNNRFNVYFDF